MEAAGGRRLVRTRRTPREGEVEFADMTSSTRSHLEKESVDAIIRHAGQNIFEDDRSAVACTVGALANC